MLAMKYDEKQQNRFFFFFTSVSYFWFTFFFVTLLWKLRLNWREKDYCILLIFYSQCFAHAAEKLSLSDGQSLTWEMKRTREKLSVCIKERKKKHKKTRVCLVSQPLASHFFCFFFLSGTGVWRCRHIKSPAFKVAFSHESEICVFFSCIYLSWERISRICGCYASGKAHFSFNFFLLFQESLKCQLRAEEWNVKVLRWVKRVCLSQTLFLV